MSITVGELIAALQKADPSLPVDITTDGRHGGGSVTRVCIEQGEWKYDTGMVRNQVLIEAYRRQDYEFLDKEFTADGLSYEVLLEKHEDKQ
jgi:hypothetical protein